MLLRTSRPHPFLDAQYAFLSFVGNWFTGRICFVILDREFHTNFPEGCRSLQQPAVNCNCV